MPIRIEHGPVTPILRLAQAAGEGRRRAYAQSQDLQLLNLSLRQQEVRDERQRSERAFALQSAMASRAARTPTAKADVRDPAMIRQIQKQKYGEVGQAQQMQQLDTMMQSGAISAAEGERNKLRILGGQGVQFEKEPTVPLSIRRLQATTERSRLEADYKALANWEGATNIEESPYGSVEGLQTAKAKINKSLRDLAIQEQAKFGLVDPTSGTRAPSGQPQGKGSPPPYRGRFKDQQEQNSETGSTWIWNGQKWE